MKKFLGIISICLTIILGFGLAGCGDNKQTLSYSIEYNMNKLTDVLNDTKEANNNDLIVPELYSLEEEETKKENNVSTISNKRFANKSKNSQKRGGGTNKKQ